MSILKQRQEVGAGSEAEGALARSIEENPAIAADVVRAMVNLLGRDEERVHSEGTMLARHEAIFDLAGKLGVREALEIVHRQPQAPEEGRPPSDDPQMWIVETLDTG